MAGSLTNFGRFCRERRANRGFIMRDQANEFGCSVAYISAVETGLKSVPDAFIERFVAWLSLSDADRSRLFQYQIEQVKIVRIRPNDNNKAYIAKQFSDLLNTMSPDQIKTLRKTMNGDRDAQ